MNDEKKHASLGDLPAWSSPMTVREIAEIRDAWGMALVRSTLTMNPALVYDERGLLWIDATVKPEARFITGAGMSHEYVLVFHHNGGLGIYLPKLAYKDLRVISDKQLENYESKGLPRYIPVNHVVSIDEIPEDVYSDDPTTRLMRTKDNSSSVTLEGKEVPGEC